MNSTGGPQMKPESRSHTLLSITRAKAKMYEYSIPEKDHIEIRRDPSGLFTLTIGLLGDLTAHSNLESIDEKYLSDLAENLVFSAHFFDSYLQSRLRRDLDPYVLLLGSASYYLCGLPGSSLLLAKNLVEDHLDLNCSGLEKFLSWLLQRKVADYSDSSSKLYGECISGISNSLCNFYKAGTDVDDLSQFTSKLRSKAYDAGNPRELFFADIICAIVKKRIENSAWFSLPRYTNIPIEQWSDALKKTSFIKELWPAQHLLGRQGIFKGKSAVIQMPTSAGKTRATQIIIRSAFLAKRTTLAVIVAPFRALCHEIKNSLLEAFHGESVSINELSDVFQSDFDIQELLEENQILVLTPEKFLYVLRHNPEIADHIGLLIYDEGHQFDNGIRGITYELLLTSLKSMVPKGIQTILMSAVIRNADSIGKWLIGEDCELVDGSKLIPTQRTIAFTTWLETRGQLEFINQEDPDKDEFFVPRVIDQQKLNLKGKETKKRFFPDRNDGHTIALFLGLKLITNGSIAIFCGRKPTVASLCEKIVYAYDRGLTINPPFEISDQKEVERLTHLYASNLGDEAIPTRSARLGIFTHHGDTPQGIRLSVEHAMKTGKVKFVICTSTLAQGVNLPIRYLIVTGIYQGIEPISVRDFHNLIGRAGRADQYTEGSIIFADPNIYDERKTHDGRWRWGQVKKLLNPGNSEPCASNLLTIFDPLRSDDHRYSVRISTIKIVSGYINDPQELDKLIERISSKYSDQTFTKEGLENQIAWKINIISSIENYLMANWDESKSELGNEDIVQLASGTLAYFLADEEQKKQLIEIFIMLEHNIEQNVTEASKRKIYGRTMYGVRMSLSIDNWVNQHIEELVAYNKQDKLLTTIWPILFENIQNNTFKKCNPPEALIDIALGWIHGQSYYDLFRVASEADVRIVAKTQKRHIKVDSIIDICDNGLSYDGTLIIGAIAEIIEILRPEDSGETVVRLFELQKRLKYGLSTPISIALYELGFSDRVVSMDLASIIKNTQLDRRSIIRFMKRNEQKFRELLDRYPSYFIERLNNLL
jgi:superfamily II DNA/RNA helicase